MQCPKQTRRLLLLTVLATGSFLAAGRSAAAQEDQPGSDERPQKGDLLVLSEGDHAREVIKPGDLMLGGPPVQWVKAEGRDKNVLKRPRHNSEFNPRESAQVVFGPAPLRLAALPMQIATVS